MAASLFRPANDLPVHFVAYHRNQRNVASQQADSGRHANKGGATA